MKEQQWKQKPMIDFFGPAVFGSPKKMKWKSIWKNSLGISLSVSFVNPINWFVVTNKKRLGLRPFQTKLNRLLEDPITALRESTNKTGHDNFETLNNFFEETNILKTLNVKVTPEEGDFSNTATRAIILLS
jgi:hypothetical protein